MATMRLVAIYLERFII